MHLDVVGTVAVTRANGQVGRALLQRLRATQAQTIALISEPAAIPADHVIVGPLDAAEAQAALRNADYVVHLAGALRPADPNSYHAANLGTAEAVARAVKGGQAKRVLFLSYVGANEESKNLYLRLKAEAERVLTGTHKDTVIFRGTHVIGSPEDPGPWATFLLAQPGKEVMVLGDGQQALAPVYVGDVAAALVTALGAGSYGTYELAGPDRMTLDALVRLLNQNPSVPIAHYPVWMARLLGMMAPTLPGPLVDVLLQDSVGDPARAIATFGLTLTSLRTIWEEAAAPLTV